jgi:hypothetical protein
LSTPRRSRHLLRDYGLSIAITVLFVISLIGAVVSGWFEYASQQASHAQAATIGGEDGYLPVLLEQVFQNWQSEFLALATLIALASVLVHKGSPESKDGDEQRARRIAAIEARVDRLVAERTGGEDVRR